MGVVSIWARLSNERCLRSRDEARTDVARGDHRHSWPDDPPASAAKIVQTYVSRLRKALGEDVIERRGGGYALRTPPASIDVVHFEQLAREGAFHEALDLWRGPALADLGSVPRLAAAAEQFEEERLGVLEQRIDLDIAAGRHEAVIIELRNLVSAHPVDERLLGQLMLASTAPGGRRRRSRCTATPTDGSTISGLHHARS